MKNTTHTTPNGINELAREVGEILAGTPHPKQTLQKFDQLVLHEVIEIEKIAIRWTGGSGNAEAEV